MNRSQFLKTLFGCVAAAAVPFKVMRRPHRVRPLPIVWRMPIGWPPTQYKHDALYHRIQRWQQWRMWMDSAFKP